MELRHRGEEGLETFTKELIAVCRHFGVFERDAVCCGTVTVQQCVALQTLLPGDDLKPNDGAKGVAKNEHDISSLAAHMGVTKSAMTRLVDGMEKRGWVARERGTRDRRRVLVKHTDPGRIEAERLRELTSQSAQAILRHIPDDEHSNVVHAMQLVHVALDKARGQDDITCC